jgi:hypothetical protein
MTTQDDTKPVGGTSDATQARAAQSTFITFSRLWGFALFAQTFSSWWWLKLVATSNETPVLALSEIAVGIVGLMLCCSPGRPGLLQIAASLHLLNLAFQLPEVPNHRLFSGFVNLEILVVLAPRRRSFAERFDEFSATLRCGLATLYGFAVFHKLNVDFLISPTSCGRVYGGETLTFLGAPASLSIAGFELYAAFPWVTLLTEAAICAMLLARRFQRLGFFVGVLFHTALIFHPTKHFIDFTAVVVAALVGSSFGARYELRRDSRLFAALFVAAGVLTPLSQLFEGSLLGVHPVYLFLWVLYFSLLGSVLKSASWQRPSGQSSILPKSAAGWLLVVLVFANGITPYLGVKNKSSWDMYANLRLEEDASNHLVVRHPLNVFGEHSELVDITESNIPALEKLRTGGERLPRLELDRIVRRSPSPSVTFSNRDGVWTITPTELSPDGYRSSAIARKLLWFRPMIAPGEPVPCGR